VRFFRAGNDARLDIIVVRPLFGLP
jgi:hypothetical protein